ncbi:ferredoxin [Amphritea opalescens]|uniref:Ferredoxin n=1 Tax=Amphritea opalescens TaxID=2490544 RepID=A0A430KPQ0_9GAMM|nr:2Fe-2S iron-sulfur cluster-binding protein [Amphritea opalescens]RTE65499.1 ferredoxin [Amphritea opalescens]
MPDSLIHQIKVVNRQLSFSCSEDQALLMGMERCNAGAINVGCRGGGCGVCKIRILSGEYEVKRMSQVHCSADQLQQGFALACRVFPRSDLEIESDHCDAVLIPGDKPAEQNE